MTAGPNMYNNKSPAPKCTGHKDPTLYDCKVDANEDWNNDNTLFVDNVNVVQMIKGWMMDVMCLGNLAPKTNEDKVVNSMNNV